MAKGIQLLDHGLAEDGSRYQAQFMVLFHLRFSGTPKDEAVAMTRAWIRARHNGHSRAVREGKWAKIDREIGRQADRIWTYAPIAPPKTGRPTTRLPARIPRSEIPRIVAACKGSLTLAGFLYHLLCHAYPRAETASGAGMRIHSKLLIAWSSRASYLDHLSRLARLGLVARDDSYLVESESKLLRLRWAFDLEAPPLQIDGAAPTSLRAAILGAFGVEEFLSALGAAGLPRYECRRVRLTVSRWSEEEARKDRNI